MTWSTRELADLTGTTVNTVRHYHQRGLLDEPDRQVNGYKQYGVEHLVQLLQIRRLRDLGVPIADIQRQGSRIGTTPEVLAALDAELAQTIERSQQARADIAEIQQHGSITEVPSGFAPVAASLSATERALMLVYSQFYNPEGMRDVRQLLEQEAADPATVEFEHLPADADESVRARLAEELAAPMVRAWKAYPWMASTEAHHRRPSSWTRAAMTETFRKIYNPAQLDVMARAGVIARKMAGLDEDPQARSIEPPAST